MFWFTGVSALAILASGTSAIPVHGGSANDTACDRACMTEIVNCLLQSFETHDPSTLPMALTYKATENSHPAALGFMTAFRTITKVGPPSLLAIDTTNSTAAFGLDIVEGNSQTPNVLRGRIKVVNGEITELELFINRYRGDHGFSFNATELPPNYAVLMSPPSNRTKATREELYELSADLFRQNSTLNVTVSDTCQFTEIGWKVVDTGTYENATDSHVGCSWPAHPPYDLNARTALVIDEELGFVVTSGMIPGTVYPYQDISAFIPDALSAPQEVQVAYLEDRVSKGQGPNLLPMKATGDTLEVLQMYDGVLQAMQINVFMGGPGMVSAWV